MERALFAAIAGVCLLLGGCLADPDTPQACRHEVGLALSAAQWDRALRLLDSRDCEVGFTLEERQMNYAAAYAGRAGFDLPELAERIIPHARLTDGRPDPERLLRLFLDFRPAWNSLTDLVRAQQHYTQLLSVQGYEPLAACRRHNRQNLTRLQRDACFHYGLVGLVQGLAAFSLLIPDQFEEWLAGRGDCSVDHNRSGMPDQAEASACALQAADEVPIEQAGNCASLPGAGTVVWQRLLSQPTLSFFDRGLPVAQLTPLQIRLQAGTSCSGERQYLRLLTPAPHPSLGLTSGYCSSSDINRRCEQLDPDADCWPCPVLLPERGVSTVHRGILQALNGEAELIFESLGEEQVAAARAEFDELKRRICAYVADTLDACELDAEGGLKINQAALREYLRGRR